MTTSKSKLLLIILSVLLISQIKLSLAQESTVNSLEQFYNHVKTLKADFKQTVYDSESSIMDESTGLLYIARPGKFRWEYTEPLAQLIICDADRIWIHDVELEQVTIRDYQQTLAGTPAELLAGIGDINRQYEITNISEQTDDVNWIKLIPRNEDTQFIEIQVGFREEKLYKMSLIDHFDRKTDLEFSNLLENPPMNLKLFNFKLPKGVDVIDNSTQP